ncbi:hypothetical protein [Chitinophaga sp. Cy-1792]|uniref:hypothetical protein n=1 Tax=Chitinophaga sp. Cy-1792 TaxID=2608339 RepID=UPI001420A04A|nr:hypothetical protein [Chitinophaga sp. Cy-1792]NIG52677.1 hypothetical protein [Chitinophaga sp. Cy-1792]
MKYTSGIILIIIFAGVVGCNNNVKDTKTGKQDKFIDIPAYFKSEEQQLIQSGITFQKKVTFNGKSEAVAIESKDTNAIQHLLKPFLDIDLNKPSLVNEYDTTSLTDPFSGRKSIIYKSKGKQTNPDEITMETDKNGTIQQVTVQSYTSSLVYEYRQHLVYQRGKAIMINTYQRIAFLTPKEVEITAKKEDKNQL